MAAGRKKKVPPAIAGYVAGDPKDTKGAKDAKTKDAKKNEFRTRIRSFFGVRH
jgi:hypothetical protein